MRLPLFSSKVVAGFPSPADDYIEKTLDLNELLIQKPAATFFASAQGFSMINAGIHPNDILVVDRSIEAVPGNIVVCALNDELTVKRLERENGHWKLKAENPDYTHIAVHENLELVIWGVVTNAIHRLYPLKDAVGGRSEEMENRHQATDAIKPYGSILLNEGLKRMKDNTKSIALLGEYTPSFSPQTSLPHCSRITPASGLPQVALTKTWTKRCRRFVMPEKITSHAWALAAVSST